MALTILTPDDVEPRFEELEVADAQLVAKHIDQQTAIGALKSTADLSAKEVVRLATVLASVDAKLVTQASNIATVQASQSAMQTKLNDGLAQLASVVKVLGALDPRVGSLEAGYKANSAKLLELDAAVKATASKLVAVETATQANSKSLTDLTARVTAIEKKVITVPVQP